MKTLMNSKSRLSAAVTYGDSKSAKCPKFTAINIMVDDAIIATCNAGGEFSQDAALKEFKRQPQRFTRTEMYEVAKGLGIVS